MVGAGHALRLLLPISTLANWHTSKLAHYPYLCLVKTLTLLFLSLLLFFGNIGIPVFTHACEEDGVFTSFFINQQSHCQEKISNLPPCCQKEKKKNCCHDEKTVVQLDEKYVQSQALSVPTFAFVCPVKTAVYSFPKSQTKELSIVQTWEDPPPIRESGRDILIQHCVFRL
ncbi:MAG: hypothetical protein RLZZ30_225 [Bacteroidota bacterium]|jgi:hypothetical protein